MKYTGTLTSRFLASWAPDKPTRKSDGPRAAGLSVLGKPKSKAYGGGTSITFSMHATIGGQKTNIGLGSLDSGVTLAEARKRAHMNLNALRHGQPLPFAPVRRTVARGPRKLTFRAVAEACMSERSAQWTGPRTLESWQRALSHVYPVIGSRAIGDITRKEIVTVLKDIAAKVSPHIAKQARTYVFTTFEHAANEGTIERNPAAGIKLPKPPKSDGTVRVPVDALPDIMEQINAINSTQRGASLATQLLAMLPCCRSNELPKMRFDEIEGDVWHIPATTKKEKRAHDAVLSRHALAIIAEARTLTSGDLVFTGARGGKLCESYARDMFAAAEVAEGSPHGLRKSFIKHAIDAGVDYELRELTQAHAIGSEVSRIYRGDADAIDRRRVVITNWNDYLIGNECG